MALWISRLPQVRETSPLPLADAQALRSIARRTWRYFQSFVSEQHHSLPPDNFQEDPKPVVAHRTSPTNIGLYLLSTICARDFGWSGTLETVERLEATLATLSQMELFRGHFYNWYDTRDLRPLEPKYVSTVDSGNLAGHLLALGNSCRELMDKSSVGPHILAGLQDAARLLCDALAAPAETPPSMTRNQLIKAVGAMMTSVQVLPVDALDWAIRIKEWKLHGYTVADIADALAHEHREDPEPELCLWAEALRSLHRQSHSRRRNSNPWARLDAKNLEELVRSRRDRTPDWMAIEPFLRGVPVLIEAPEQFDAALRELSLLTDRPLHDRPADQGSIRRIDALTEALKRSASGSHSAYPTAVDDH